jgi:translation initiation factor 5B
MSKRKPIVAIMGHVDHGKTKILDKIRKSTVVDREAGAITQAIGASIVPMETIKRICGPLLANMKSEMDLPGLLFIDTPGHAAFTNLRKRGGNLADIAIVVININEGLKPQTKEALEILKQYKTPFVIALNKIDLISGWRIKDNILLKNIEMQSEETKTLLDTKLYEIVGMIHEMGFQSERFDRIDDHTKQIALIPTSAITGEGIPELLMILSGLAQKFLDKCLTCNIEGLGKGTILEVKEEKGLGVTLDVIIYDGKIKVKDTIILGTTSDPIVTKIRGLLEPNPLAEMRDKKSKFKQIKEVVAATGVKIIAPGLENAMGGMPIRVALENDIEKVKKEIKNEIEEVILETDNNGIIIKADSIGSLEALITLLREHDIQIRKANLGNITKKDINDAQSNYEEDPLKTIILGFNIEMTPDAQEFISSTNVKILTNQVIYRLLEDYEKWNEIESKKIECDKISCITRPCKVEIMKGYIFRQNNPAVFGVDVMEGELRTNMKLMKSDGAKLNVVKGLQADSKKVEKAEKNKQVAVSIDGITVGRHVNEGDILYSEINQEEFRKLKEMKEVLSKEEIEILKEIAIIKRKENPMWGI